MDGRRREVHEGLQENVIALGEGARLLPVIHIERPDDVLHVAQGHAEDGEDVVVDGAFALEPGVGLGIGRQDPLFLVDRRLDNRQGQLLDVHELVRIERAGDSGVDVAVDVAEKDDTPLGMQVLYGEIHDVLEEGLERREGVHHMREPVESLEVLRLLGDLRLFAGRGRLFCHTFPFTASSWVWARLTRESSLASFPVTDFAAFS